MSRRGGGGEKRIEMSDKRYKLDVEKYILGAYCWRLCKMGRRWRLEGKRGIPPRVNNIFFLGNYTQEDKILGGNKGIVFIILGLIGKGGRDWGRKGERGGDHD